MGGGKQKKKSLSSRVSRRDPNDEEFDDALAEFHKSSDRVAAIMGAALVDNALVEAIKTCLVDDSDEGKLFHEPTSPFGSLHARTIAAKALGLLNPALAADLDVVRDVRNQFAHALLRIDFKDPDIAGECEKLKRYPERYTPRARRRAVPPARKYYERACYTLAIVLMSKTSANLNRRTVELRQQYEAEQAKLSLNDLVTAALKGGS